MPNMTGRALPERRGQKRGRPQNTTQKSCVPMLRLSTIVASLVTVAYALGFLLVGAVLRFVAGSVLARSDLGQQTGALLGAILVGLLGYAVGSAKAFYLKLEAQRTLC